MKVFKTIYWIATSVVALMMMFSAYAYLTQPAVEQSFQHLGYPGYFRVELAVAKMIGAVLILVPVGANIKEWVYAGFTITFISAFIAHVVSADPVFYRIAPLFFLTLLAVSYFTYHKSHIITQNKGSVQQAM